MIPDRDVKYLFVMGMGKDLKIYKIWGGGMFIFRAANLLYQDNLNCAIHLNPFSILEIRGFVISVGQRF